MRLAVAVRKAVLNFLFPTPVARVWVTDPDILDSTVTVIRETHKDGDRLYFRKINGETCGFLPRQQYEGDAGWDLFCVETTTIQPKSFQDVSTGIMVDIPDGLWVRITGRSSTVRKWGLQVQEAIIDNGYTGEMFIGVWNLTDNLITIGKGARLAQFMFFRLQPVGWVFSPPRDKERGSKGFGSTGE